MQDTLLANSDVALLPAPFSAPVAAALGELRATHAATLAAFEARGEALARIATALVKTLRAGGTVLVAGNGGSAAEAQHFAGELVGRFKLERRPYAAVALCVDSAILTAVANDYGYADVFARQVLALGRPGDLLLTYSTSGESENLVQAVLAARQRGMTVAAVTGDRPNRLETLVDLPLRVPSTDTPVVQELQMMVTHILCEIAERELAAWDVEATG